VREHGKNFKATTKAVTSYANSSSGTINAVAWNWTICLALVLVPAAMLFATMSTGVPHWFRAS
jgi:hypothetical protein